MEQKPNRMSELLRSQGFYIVLALCLLVVGTGVALSVLPKQAVETPITGSPVPLVESNVSSDERLSAPTAAPAATKAPTPLPTVSPAPTAAPTVKPASSEGQNKAVAPVSGKVVWGFAADKLLYSRTLDQWTTHMGVDIAADQGSKVRAVLTGTVLDIYEDDALGVVVTVEHSNKRMTLYANLDEQVQVKKGQKINAGDVIGTVGNTALSECGEVAHLHFGFFVGGKPVDPFAYVLLEK